MMNIPAFCGLGKPVISTHFNKSNNLPSRLLGRFVIRLLFLNLAESSDPALSPLITHPPKSA